MKQLFMQSVYYMVVATFLVNCCVQVGILLYGTHLVCILAVSICRVNTRFSLLCALEARKARWVAISATI